MKKGILQKELARDLSVSGGTISNWENGRRMPSIEELGRVAEYFGVSLNAFDAKIPEVSEPVSTAAMTYKFQSIRFRELGYVVSKSFDILFIVALLLIPISLLLFQAFAWAVYFLSVTAIVVIFLILTYHEVAEMMRNKKTCLFPITHEIVYIHSANEELLSGIIKSHTTVSSLMLAVSGLSFTGTVVFLYPYTSVAVNVVITLSGLASIFLAYLRTVHVSKNMIFNKEIPYHISTKNLGSVSIKLAPIVMTFAYLFITYHTIDVFDNLNRILLMVVILLLASVTYYDYRFHIRYQAFIRDYVLCSRHDSITDCFS